MQHLLLAIAELHLSLTICLCLQVIFQAKEGQLVVDDGYQPPVTLVSPHREVLGATFHTFILRSVGMYEQCYDNRSCKTELVDLLQCDLKGTHCSNLGVCDQISGV